MGVLHIIKFVVPNELIRRRSITIEQFEYDFHDESRYVSDATDSKPSSFCFLATRMSDKLRYFAAAAGVIKILAARICIFSLFCISFDVSDRTGKKK